MLNLQTPALGGGAAEPAASLHPNKATTTGKSSVMHQADPNVTLLLLPPLLICERDSKTLNFPGVAVPACGMEDFTSPSVRQSVVEMVMKGLAQ